MELHKDISFVFDSKVRDVGAFRSGFRLLRRTARRATMVVTTKSALTSGLTPVTPGDRQLVDTIATLTILVQKIDANGKMQQDAGWIDDILDFEILYALHEKFLEWEDSLMIDPTGLGKEGGTSAQPSSQTAV